MNFVAARSASRASRVVAFMSSGFKLDYVV